ncbi:DNA-3-methyladenine glycosylase [Luteolibacter sp. AS25]|uniref:DNA-3-methyladenine glycosylase n=1 Tax=Luteolibacter sp. AS25 TaxID=3135776 RepID=UPI00398AA85D
MGADSKYRPLTAADFKKDPVDCARELIGSELHWKGCAGRIVETEAYRAIGDEACHTWLRPSSRKFIEVHDAGDAYVYLNYGVHWLFNILIKGPNGNGFVLIRALEPISGIDSMRERRKGMADRQLTSGPGRLTQALGIGRHDHGISFLQDEDCGIRAGSSEKITAGPRIGISKAVDLPWRFGDPSSKYLSKRFPVDTILE